MLSINQPLQLCTQLVWILQSWPQIKKIYMLKILPTCTCPKRFSLLSLFSSILCMDPSLDAQCVLPSHKTWDPPSWNAICLHLFFQISFISLPFFSFFNFPSLPRAFHSLPPTFFFYCFLLHFISFSSLYSSKSSTCSSLAFFSYKFPSSQIMQLASLLDAIGFNIQSTFPFLFLFLLSLFYFLLFSFQLSSSMNHAIPPFSNSFVFLSFFSFISFNPYHAAWPNLTPHYWF